MSFPWLPGALLSVNGVIESLRHLLLKVDYANFVFSQEIIESPCDDRFGSKIFLFNAVLNTFLDKVYLVGFF